jgi:hypothetical protein
MRLYNQIPPKHNLNGPEGCELVGLEGSVSVASLASKYSWLHRCFWAYAWRPVQPKSVTPDTSYSEPLLSPCEPLCCTTAVIRHCYVCAGRQTLSPDRSKPPSNSMVSTPAACSNKGVVRFNIDSYVYLGQT